MSCSAERACGDSVIHYCLALLLSHAVLLNKPGSTLLDFGWQEGDQSSSLCGKLEAGCGNLGPKGALTAQSYLLYLPMQQGSGTNAASTVSQSFGL